ncbi:hypothetical protein ABIA39_007539 [Nocardia sp. GAS34]|uniref:hypothetical protein n=1 Tax=unclassified Nocardia TaxID=2637762 RepID=UPI003D1D8D2D
MSGADPVEEGGQAVRTGFIQAMQTSAMVMNLMQRRGAERRSVAEFTVRQEDRAAEQGRKTEIHTLQQQGYLDRSDQGKELHDLDVKIKQARLDHDAAEAVRRRTASENAEQRWDKLNRLQVRGLRAEHNRQDAIHKLKVQGYQARAAQGRHLHSLDVQYKKLLIDARRRSAGFTETLAEYGQDTYNTTTSVAAWASAQSAADLSDEHRTHADAYADRYAEDTGNDPREVIDAVVVPLDEFGSTGESDWSPMVFEAADGLAHELAYGIYGEYLHEFSDPGIDEGRTETGTQISDAVDAVSVSGISPELDMGPQPQPPSYEPSATPEVEP